MSPDGINARLEYTREGQAKTRMLNNIPNAYERQLNSWGGKTVKKLKYMVSGRGIIKPQSGKLRRNIGMRFWTLRHKYMLTVGTGTGVFKEGVKYAKILDEGGTIRAKNRTYFYRTIDGQRNKYQFKNGPYLYVPLYKGGMRKKGEPYSFRLVKTVRIPPFKWFTKPIEKMKPELDRMMNKLEILKCAKRL